MGTRLYLALFVLAVVILFTVQNAEVVEVKFLFWSGSMSRALLLFFVFLGGLLSGWLLTEFSLIRKRGQAD